MKKYFKYAMIGIAAGFVNGLMGAGGGTIIVPALERILKIEEHKAHATAIFIILSFTLVSIGFYAFSTELDLMLLLWVSAGGIVGGIIGARLLAKLSAKWLHKIFGVFLIIAGIGMMFR